MAGDPKDTELLRACGRGDADAIARFEARYFAGIPAALARMKLPPDAIDEVIQMVREKLFVARPDAPPRVVELAEHANLRALVKVTAVRTALDLRRRDRRIDPSGDGAVLDAIAPDADPELAALREEQRAAVKLAIEDAVRALAPRERSLLRLHLIHRLSMGEIAGIYGVHLATAARWLARVRDKLELESKRRLRERTGLDGAELDSAVQAAQSRLEVSFRRLLDTQDG